MIKRLLGFKPFFEFGAIFGSTLKWFLICMAIHVPVQLQFICKLNFTNFTLKALLVHLMIILMSFVTRKSLNSLLQPSMGHVYLSLTLCLLTRWTLYCVQLVNPTWHSLHISIHFFPFMGSLYSFISNTDTANEITTSYIVG